MWANLRYSQENRVVHCMLENKIDNIFWQSFTIKGKIVADATLVAVLGPTILSLKTDDNSGGTHFRIRLCNA